ncbi:MAG: asparagine--tRNA ligase [Candidatus Izemoplasmatales bacterium]|jgi:asparaginyl-tRNA synthetase|nr:asparagine--tRNA ligase [Candidatus Izemoplasmatales bacterium]MDD3865518.1 asparagine--tRNA ligase [Candidatus Izemoplasmatales bacterium]
MDITIKELYQKYLESAGKHVTISGWIRNSRAQKEFGFIDLNDGSFFETIQVVYEENEVSNFKDIQKFRVGSSITVEGILSVTPNMKQPFEIKATMITLVGDSPENYPIQPKRHSREFLRENAHLRMRTNLFSAVFRVRSEVSYAIHSFFHDRNFVYVHTPIVTGSDAEGAGEMFKVTTLDIEKILQSDAKAIDYSKDFFGKATNLTVSGQLQVETYAMAFRNVYTFGPTFRAENSNTQRHASEFWMIEPEIAFADLHDDMRLAEEMVKYVIRYILEHCSKEVDFFNDFVEKGLRSKLEKVVNSDFQVVTHHDAISILKAAKEQFENQPEYGEDLATEHEKYLTKYFDGPVFVIDWPKEIKAFYMRVNPDGKTVAAMDLLVPGSGELIGGSQREERLDVLEKKMQNLHIDKSNYWWYLDLRKYGGCPHAGFGLGLERMIMYVTGIDNIRDVIPFPRTPKNCEF